VLASRAANRFGTPASGGALAPSIARDGRLVVFEARASNLHPDDRDRSGDIFLRDLGPDPFGARVRAGCLGRRANAIVLPRSSSPFEGTDHADVVVGSSGRDRLSGGPGRDRLCGRGGRDLIRSRDGRRDRVDCGPGRDRVVADERDRVRGCELR
jgi:Ca2+-binding RTX toxin-like protein